MKDGKTGLFDTKSLRADISDANKHNALQQWITKNGEQYFGGVLIPVETAGIWKFYYSELLLTENIFIENTTGFTDISTKLS